MDVILKTDIKGLGYKNDLVAVKPGYGRNYLIPQGFAVLATKSNKRILEEKGIAHKRLMLCCQAYHARRAFMTFERYFQDSSFNVVPSVTMDITRKNR